MTITKDSLETSPVVKETKYKEPPQGGIDEGLKTVKKKMAPKPKSEKVSFNPSR